MTPDLRTADHIGAAISDARTELGRVDAKAGTLLGIDGVLLGLVGSVLLTQLQGAAAVLGWLAESLYAASAAALLVAVYPRLPRLPGSLYDQSTMTPAQLAESYADADAVIAHRAGQLPGMARLALAKYRNVQQAVWLLAAGVAVLLVTLAVQLAH
ncbi:Pycsar system effector family protein [Hamadaea sp. NPDC051192]|uniref:Pycsar system effector family protein n=1 Tax=Hamadaea sp. NPDC051192 TaxID=3154940 RepID=UPI003427B534